MNALRAMLSHAEEKGVLSVHPLKGLKPLAVVDDERVRYLESDEEKRLLNALDAREEEIRKGRESHNAWLLQRGMEPLPNLEGKAFVDHLKPIVLLALHTGLRRGEILGLEWSAVNFKTETLTVTARTAKTAKTRHVHLNQIALGILQKWREQSKEEGLVFPGRNGQKMASLKTAWAGLLKRASIVDFHLHDCRHDFASKLVMRGVDLYVVKDLLGHASITMTERYAHLAPGHKAKAVALLAMGQ
ncbi:MAG: site-specific integrase [Magnetococcus sp. DMHC-1]|nr:site-specific integrase [Magnetococcales bacterium]